MWTSIEVIQRESDDNTIIMKYYFVFSVLSSVQCSVRQAAAQLRRRPDCNRDISSGGFSYISYISFSDAVGLVLALTSSDLCVLQLRPQCSYSPYRLCICSWPDADLLPRCRGRRGRRGWGWGGVMRKGRRMSLLFLCLTHTHLADVMGGFYSLSFHVSHRENCSFFKLLLSI